MDPTPVAVVVEDAVVCCTFEQWMAIIGAIGALVSGPILLIVREVRNGNRAAEARGVTFMEVENRKLNANPDTTPVNTYRPPTGTGDGSLDKAVREFVAKATPPPGDAA